MSESGVHMLQICKVPVTSPVGCLIYAGASWKLKPQPGASIQSVQTEETMVACIDSGVRGGAL